MRFALSHLTLYEYDKLVGLGPQTIRLRPMSHCPSTVLFHSITIEPNGHEIAWLNDELDNPIAVLNFEQKIRRLSISVDLVIDTPQVMAPGVHPLSTQHYFGTSTPFVFSAPAQSSEAVQNFAYACCPTGLSALQTAQTLNQAIHQNIHYNIRTEPGVQSTEQTLMLKSGSCRDSAWLLVQLLRQRGFIARFVSGYLIDLPAQSEWNQHHTPNMAEHQHTELHAWCEVWTPDMAWVGLDPTSGLFSGFGHIPLATGINTEQASPLTGWLEPCQVAFSHSMQLRWIKT